MECKAKIKFEVSRRDSERVMADGFYFKVFCTINFTNWPTHIIKKEVRYRTLKKY